MSKRGACRSIDETHECVLCKADGYGHGAIATALFLADHMGADAFAVATLEEGIALRKAFQQTPPGATYKSGQPLAKKTSASVNRVSSLFSETQTTSTTINSSIENGLRRRRFQRASQIRILVLGPAIYVPRCFDDYSFYNIEVMISGPEVAKALLEWIHNTEERRRTQVERAATETKELAMQLQSHIRPAPQQRTADSTLDKKDSSTISDASSEQSKGSNGDSTQKYRPPSATLGNVTGMDLAKEVRKILKNQIQSNGSDMSNSSTNAPVSAGAKPVTTQVFAGIEEAAKVSRSRHKAIVKEAFVERGDEEDGTKSTDVSSIHQKSPAVLGSRKRLRWHALVDSGMGRLGFRTDPVSKSEQGKRRDTVEILSELVDIENNLESPVEFVGMCTHMADANSSSDYTHSQIARFKVNYKKLQTDMYLSCVHTADHIALSFLALLRFYL
jgi:alanine racemase